MKRPITLIFAAILVVAMLAGCAGNIIVVQMPTEAEDTTPVHTPAGDDAVKTGLAVFTSVSDSTSAVEGTEGEIKYDITLAAVTVDDNGVIHSARIDSIPATLTMDNTGNITSNLTVEIPTKNELGADYGMVAWGGAVAEWDEQVAALCDYAVGKTVDELKNGAIDESGKAPAGSDLATSATIYLGGYVNALEAAVNNAKHLGASGGDKLSLVTINSLTKSTAATAEEAGLAQLDASIAVVTSAEGVITSCIIDAVQAKVNFDATGSITTDLTAAIYTKNELGADYGMVAWGGAVAEWNEQAASFAAYVTGKTADEVAGIAVSEGKAADADLATTVTISIGGFQALIAKALA